MHITKCIYKDKLHSYRLFTFPYISCVFLCSTFHASESYRSISSNFNWFHLHSLSFIQYRIHTELRGSGVGIPPFLTINAFEWGHIVGNHLLYPVLGTPFEKWPAPPLWHAIHLITILYSVLYRNRQVL